MTTSISAAADAGSDDEKAKVTGGTEISVIETKGKTKTVLTTDINDLWVLSHLYNQLFMDEHIKQQQEALKALGIEMGTPYYQLKHREKSGELGVCRTSTC